MAIKTRIKNSIGKLILVLLIAGGYQLTADEAFSAWLENIIDSTNTTIYMSVDIDTNGYARISYLDSNNNDLKYAYFDGTNWNIQTIATNNATGAYTSLKIDSNGYTHISYQDNFGDIPVLNYASYNGTGWDIQTVGSSGTGLYTSLELDSNGYAHIATHEEGDMALHYVSYNGTGWNTDVIAYGAGTETSLDLDSDGYAHISYKDFEQGALHYSKYNGTGWNIQAVDTSGITYQSSIDLDSDGYAHISYVMGSNLKYASFNGSGWDIQTISTAIGYTSMMLDSQGRPYISYITIPSGTYTLNLAHFNGTGWETEVLKTYGYGYPTDTSLSLFNDYVYVTYANNGDLAIITNAPQGFVKEPSLNVLGIIIFMLLICLWSGNQRLPLGLWPKS